MGKRDFRPAAGKESGGAPAVPTLDDFDRDRRAFLGRLGAALGLGALAAACGGRAVNESDGGRKTTEHTGFDGGPSGVAPAPDAEIENPPVPSDAGPPDPDWDVMGDMPAPDARVDNSPDWGIAGGMPAPDARVDPDGMMTAGVAPAPDARVDPDGMVSPGFAPAMDARVDGEECPN